MRLYKLNRLFLLLLLLLPIAGLGNKLWARKNPKNAVITRGVIDSYGNRRPVSTTRQRTRRRSSKTGAIKIIRRGELARWVNQMLLRVKPHLKRKDEKGMRYRVRLIDHSSINAMALADGRIFFTKGLMKFVKSDDELAAVLCHECAHVEMRHHPKRSLKQMLWTGLAMLGAALAKAERAGFLGAQLLGNLATLSYGRGQEFEADRVGFYLCEKAGYNPSAMQDFIERLLEYEKKHSKFSVHPIFSSHPPSYERARKIGQLMKGRGPYPPKVLTYNPGRLFYSPMQWSQELPGLANNIKGTSRYGDLLGTGSFDHPDMMTVGWSVLGDGASRLVKDTVAIGEGSLKLWASGGKGLSLYSPPLPMPNDPSEAVIEYVASGPLGSSLIAEIVVEPEEGKQEHHLLEEAQVIERAGWRFVRLEVGQLLAKLNKQEELIQTASLSPLPARRSETVFRLRFAVPAGLRGPLWIDEIRFGLPTGKTLLSNSFLTTNIVDNGGFEEKIDGETIPGWSVLSGSGSLTEKGKGARMDSRALEIKTAPGERRIVLVSEPIDVSSLVGGYMVRFFAKASRDTRLFAGIESVSDEEKEWEPDGGSSCGKTWKRVRVYKNGLPEGDDPIRIRVEFSGAMPDFSVLIDDVAMVSLLKGNRERSEP